jgi:hypothetical protein
MEHCQQVRLQLELWMLVRAQQGALLHPDWLGEELAMVCQLVAAMVKEHRELGFLEAEEDLSHAHQAYQQLQMD